MPTLLTVKEAAKAIGKSPSAVRRIIYPIIKDDQHPDRKHIEPSAEDAVKLRMKGENFAWRIEEDFLLRVSPITKEPATESAKGDSSLPADGSSTIIALLQQELTIKNEQIAAQNHMMQGLSERLHESNVLLATLQRQLALTDGKTPEPTPMEKSAKPAVKSAKSEKGSTIPTKSLKPKRGFFARLFH